MQQPNRKKITCLESMRGFAAFSVFLFHFMLAFLPGRHGQERDTLIRGGNLKETPFFFFINGHAAVVFFFVLSGFVLSYRYFRTGSNSGMAYSVVKRWPRLFPLALISTVVSCFLIHQELYSYAEAAKVTKSYWMGSFARARPGFLNASYWDALLQGGFLTFFRGDKNLNTSLWTMRHEFYGSLVVFATAAVLNGLRGKIVFLLFVLLQVAAYFTNVFLFAFVSGCFLAHYRVQVRKGQTRKYPWPVIVAVLVLCFLVLGYIEPGTGMYRFMRFYDRERELAFSVRIILHSLAAVAAIEMVLSSERLSGFFDRPTGRFLGRCSFALYVIHVPLMFSFSTWVFLSSHKSLGPAGSAALTFLLTLPLLLLASWGLSRVDENWYRFINRVFRPPVNDSQKERT